MDTPPIDHLDLEAEKLFIRGTDLEDLIVSRSFADAVRLVLGGVPEPDPEAFLKTCFQTYFDDRSGREAIVAAIRDVADPPHALMIGLLLAAGRGNIPSGAGRDLDEKTLGAALGAFLPCILADFTRLDPSFKPPRAVYSRPTGEIVHCLASEPGSACPEAFERVLVAMLGGFGVATPSVMAPRVAAGTGAGMASCLVASMTTSGASHLGACSRFMAFFQAFRRQARHGDAQAWIAGKLRRQERIPGFGHPVLTCDPRVAVLKRYCRQGPDLELLAAAERIMRDQKDAPLNIDGIAGFVFLDSGVGEHAGTPLFLFARSFAAVAHAVQRKEIPPFGGSRTELRDKFKSYPTGWV